MLEAIEKLLILQERDRQIGQLEAELASIPPQRNARQQNAAAAHARAEAGRKRVLELETARKELELEVQTLEENVRRYSHQQYQTKKNDEYQALAREIDAAKSRITRLDDRQIEFMEQIEAAQKQAAQLAREAADIQAVVDRELADLEDRDRNLRTHLAELMAGRQTLAEAAEPALLARYERLRKSKGGRVLVGIDGGTCGGCHIKLQPQLLITCRADQEVTSCSSCGRILYYERGMDL